MTNKLDNQLIVRIGLVVHANPIRKLYQLQPDGYLDGGPLIFAVPINSLSRDSKPTRVDVYAPGDFVLYVAYEDHLGYGAFFQAIILGSVPGTKTAAEADRTRLNSILGEINSDISGYLSELYQDSLLKNKGGAVVSDQEDRSEYDYQGGIPDDFTEAANITTGLNTVVEQTDYAITEKAGRAQVSLDATNGVALLSAPFILENSFSTEHKSQLIGGYLQDTKQLSIQINEENYLYSEQFGAYSYGKLSIINDIYGVPQSTIHQRLDGRLDIKAKQGISLEKDIPLPVRYVNRDESIIFDVESDRIPEVTSEESLYDLIDGWDIWDKIEEAANNDDAGAVPVGLGELDLFDSHSDSTEDPLLNKENKSVSLKSCIRLLPSGGIVIRDAWGSEIRLEGGNIQLSAANNLISIAGRDKLDIVGGVYTANANEAIELGANNKNVTIYGNECKLFAKSKASVVAQELNVLSEGYISIKGECLTTDISALNLLSKGILSIAGTQVSVNGKLCSITTDSSAIVLNGSSVQLGASIVDLRSALYMKESGLNVSNVIDYKGNHKEIKTPEVIMPSIFCNGYVISNKDFRCVGDIVVHGDVQANRFMAKDAVLGYGVYGIKKAPKVDKIDTGKRLNISLADISELLKKCKEFFTDLFISKIKKVFTLSSAAATIRQPAFNTYMTNSCKPVSTGSGGNKTYIYPGKDFWESSGMYQYQEDCLNLADYKKSTLTGASHLTLNQSNVKED